MREDETAAAVVKVSDLTSQKSQAHLWQIPRREIPVASRIYRTETQNTRSAADWPGFGFTSRRRIRVAAGAARELTLCNVAARPASLRNRLRKFLTRSNHVSALQSRRSRMGAHAAGMRPACLVETDDPSSPAASGNHPVTSADSLCCPRDETSASHALSSASLPAESEPTSRLSHRVQCADL